MAGTVNDGKVISVSDTRGNGEPIAQPDLIHFKSIEELFDVIKNESSRADFLAVQIDASLKFPSFIDIDSYALAADDEIQYRASDVQLIP
jgi:hypothetical protein